MPTRKNPSGGSASVPQLPSRGDSSSGVAALVAQQQQQQAQFDKLLKTIEKLQQENQQQVAAAAQAGGSAATQVANQVAQGVEKASRESARSQERAEDKDFAASQLKLQSELRSDAAREAAAMGQAIMSQREGMLRFRDDFLQKKADSKERIVAFRARTDKMLSAGHFSSREGRRVLAQRIHLQDMMEANGDDHFDDRYISEAYRTHNDNIQGLIAGDDPMDLSKLQVDPLQLPMVQTQKSGKRIAQQGELSPEKMFEMKLYGGYPAKGTVFNDEPNFGMPTGHEPKLLDAATMMNIIETDDYLRMANDTSLRQELERKTKTTVVEGLDKLEDMKESYELFNKTFSPQAAGAVQTAIENFLADEDPTKFNDMGRNLTGRALKEMFGGDEKGGKMAALAMQMFDGKKEMKTKEEMFTAMAFESAVFNISRQMMSEFQSAGEEGGSLATQLVKDMQEQLGEEQALFALGVPQGAVGLVNAQDVMQGRLTDAQSFASQMHTGFWHGSALTGFREQLQTFARQADIHAFRAVQEAETSVDRANHLLNITPKDEASSFISEDIAGRSAAEISTQEPFADTKLQTSGSMMSSLIGLSQNLGPDTERGVVSFVTNNLLDAKSPNLKAYRAQVQVERESGGYSKSAMDVSRFQYDRNERAKKARQEREAAGQPSLEDSFAKGGLAGVATEQVPPLVGLAAQGTGNVIARTFVGVNQLIAGKSVAESSLRGAGAVAGKQPLPFPGETAQMSNLTLQEKNQIIRESNKEN